MLKAIQDSRKQLKALETLSNATLEVEEHFSDELHIFFQYLGRKILENVDLEQPLNAIFYQQVSSVIDEYWKEYDEILSYYVDVGGQIGYSYYKVLLSASNERAKRFEATKAKDNSRQFLNNRLSSSNNNELWAPNPRVADGLERYKFEASEKTKARVNNEINDILAEGYREGWGHRDVASRIQKRFTDLSTYESRRIAQTEINTSRNFVNFNQLMDDGIEYKIWHAAHDTRTRKSHLKVDEEIVPINEKFSNGLMYPGDKSGPIEEWVNCRCSHAAYIMPLGYTAPDFWPFTENDLVKVGSSLSKDYVSEIQERIRLIDGAMVREQETREVEKPPVVEPVVKPKPKKPKAKPKPKPVKIYEDIDKGKPVTIYEYENYTIGMHKNVKYTTIDEITNHLDNLPKELLNHNSKIYVMDVPEPKGNAGTFVGLPNGDVRLWDMRKTFKDDALKKTVEMTPMDVLTHELAHAVDYSKDSFQLKYSFPDDYEKIVKADNKLYSYINENTGRRRTPDVFPTSYAGRSFFKKKRDSFVRFERYIEDFAESTKLYLNPKYHKEFCDTFPNRAQYLERIYGKPKFRR